MKGKVLNTQAIKRGLLLLIMVAILTLITTGIVQSFNPKHTFSKSKAPEVFIPTGSYENFLKEKQGIPADVLDQYPLEFAKLPLPTLDEDIILFGKDGEISEDALNFKIGDNDTLETTDSGSATWTVDITEAGLYNIYVNYLPISDGGASVERKIYINNKIQYRDLENVKFPRYWTNKGPIIQDTSGNDMKPSQKEILDIQRTSFLRDYTGYVINPYLIYFNKGINTITIESVREAMGIVSIGVTDYKEQLTYDEYRELHKDVKVQELSEAIKIEGEDASERTSPTLYAISDRTDPNNYPVDVVKIKLNAIGGTKWTTPGDAITWEVDLTNQESGLYYISFRSKQDSARGMFSTRRVYINGKIPFVEANMSRFSYSSDYKIVTLGSEDEPFLFYLEGGKVNTITLEATLGDYGVPINRVQEVINQLNNLYLRIIAVTTIKPDPNQEYYIYGENSRVEGTLETFEEAAITLDEISKYITSISGEKSDKEAILDTMVVQLRKMIENPRSITLRLKDFSKNISSLGTWISDVKQQPLQIEALYVHKSLDQLPKANANFFSGTWFGVRGFVKSFFFDYESIGTLQLLDTDREVEVWFLTSESAGREQANAISTLISNSLTEFLEEDGKSPINVKLKVVAPGVLRSATLANTGPDVAINVENGLPVNYAMRNAIMDISVFDEFHEVTGICSAANADKGLCNANEDLNAERLDDPNEQYLFFESAMVPYKYDKGYYALPNTQSFLVMFYRTDIFQERNWTVPETWREVTSLVTELSISNLQFYLPLSTSGASSVVNQVFATMLYQRGGSFYRNDNKESNFDSEEAMQAFESWTQYYTDYSFPLAASFLNRFRTGETPIGIAAYELFNTITVFAPEIAGKWEFAPLPGTISEDGVFNNSGAASGSSVVMLKNAKDPESSWDFMRWWVSKNTQRDYARELESILGAAARHNTANVLAFKNLPWTRDEQKVLISQWQKSVGVPEVPGGYYTGRNIENAFRKVVNNSANPRETLQEYIILINAEIAKKRAEFGLDN